MGADYEGQEKAVEKVRALPEEVKMLLSHHLRNSLQGILGGAQTGMLELVEKDAKHMVEDLKKFGL
ncbi:MAG TPA: hypothetical protein ENG95_07395 [Nitrospirae bacterium]|nr:hypothetical protein [Nitrospirota bacterium]HDK16574.1 hypothetical protein [Nitrospirota bacterium]HDK81040.1 hypothetical protein [Nitrospirota bacterium]HDO26451.1 hypothetical protein [Nitrospirota bacterium]